jgi:hypothetical protein
MRTRATHQSIRAPMSAAPSHKPRAAARKAQASVPAPAPRSRAEKPFMPAVNTFADPPGFVPPLDIGIPYDPGLISKYREVLPKGGQVTSRLEHETKWTVDLAKLGEFRTKLQALVDDPKLREKVLGKGWTLNVVTKYYRPDGTLEPMYDTYYDSKDLILAKAQAALRFRALKGDPLNGINIKPGPGSTDPFGVTTRIEYGMLVSGGLKDNPQAMRRFFESNEHLNIFRFLQQQVPGVMPAAVLRPSMRIVDYRFKLEAKHVDGTEIELSLDDVYATLLGDSKNKVIDLQAARGLPKEVGKDGPTVHFGQLELEVNHMQLTANNVVSSSAPAAGNGDMSLEQLAAMLNGRQATLGGAPRIHLPSDIHNPALKKDGTYIRHQKFTASMEEYLYGGRGKAPLGKQKMHVAAKLHGVIR